MTDQEANAARLPEELRPQTVGVRATPLAENARGRTDRGNALEDDAEKERIIKLSDEQAWVEAAADFIGDKHEVFSQMVMAMCERTEVSFWRNFLRMKKRVVQVHAVHQFFGDDYPAALARCWLWHKQFEKGRNQSTL